MPAGYHPIIYVRGYAATQTEIDQAVDDPFSGFNLGSTILRPDGPTARPEPYAFEGPLVQLRERHGYVDTIEDGRHNVLPGKIAAPNRSIWIFRHYDRASTRFAVQRDRPLMVEIAWSLYEFVGHVLRATGAPRVHLVAHSMGGLICRCLIQKIYPDMAADPAMAAYRAARPSDEIARLFTYATPHGGIALRNPVADLAGNLMQLGLLGAEVFRREAMVDYLRRSDTPRPDPARFDPQAMDGFPLEDVFCLVGTNAADYPVASGFSRLLIGPDSDGLVQIQRAFVRGAGRAHLHRSHSGPFGIVNSHEAFRHLEDFLFGGPPITIVLEPGDPTKRHSDPDRDPEPGGRGRRPIHVDVRAARLGGSELAHEATRERFCPEIIREESGQFEPVPLLTLPRRYVEETEVEVRLQLGMYAGPAPGDLPPERARQVGSFPGIPDWMDTLEIRLTGEAVLARWLGETAWTPFAEPRSLPPSFRLFEPRPRLVLRSLEEHGTTADTTVPGTVSPGGTPATADEIEALGMKLRDVRSTAGHEPRGIYERA